LATIPRLRKLRFRADRALEVDSLQSCPALDHLALVNLSSDVPLTHYLPSRALHSLELEGNDLTDLSPLADIEQLSELETLSLSFCEELVSVKGIENIAGTLRSLVLGGRNPAIELSTLPSLRRLERLELDWNPRPDLSVIRDMPTLRELYLDDNQPADLTPLRGVEGLTVHVRKTQEVLGAELLGERSAVIRA